MLEKLTIDNYALIDNSIIDFEKGFTVITGETGAGKSIMLDALSLIKGSRADSKAMGNKERKMMVEAIFSNPDPSLKKICEENGIEWDPSELILRREVSVSGKSRSFVNDTPVTLATLSKVAEDTVDIHSQNTNALLNRPLEQLAIVDAFGGNLSILEDYKTVFHKYVILRNRLKKIKEDIIQGKENKEFILFRLEQLNKLKPKRGELSALERESEILGDADKIKSGLVEAQNTLSGKSNSTIKQLQIVSGLLEDIDLSLLDPDGEDDIVERLNSMKVELRDISDTIETYIDKVKADPERYDMVQSRIESLYEAMKRFKVKDEAELVDMHQQLKEELSSISGNGENVAKIEAELKELARQLKDNADRLSEARERASIKFAETIEEKIRPLGLPNFKFKIDVKKGKMTHDGQDQIVFYCSFNKNHPIQPISEIASGGEIARVMLGIKSVMAEKMNLPTVIFDEIDTGVSGEIAHKMGKMMHEMSKTMQVMAVTHLPQVAASGDTHMKVFKSDNNEKTVSRIKKLEPDQRVIEIAGMLSGSIINEAAMENAKILLQNETLNLK